MNTSTIKQSRSAIVYALGVALLCGAARAEEPVGVEKEEESALELGVDFDWYSAYVWRNAVQNDQMVLQPGVWADFTFAGPFSIGGSVWQNYDVTPRRSEIYQTGLNETDFNVHFGWAAWTSDDNEYSLKFELGHEWYLYHNVRADRDVYAKNAYPNTREIYAKAEFENPIVTVYGQASWMYEDFGDYQQGMHYEAGLKKEVEFAEGWTLGADWNVNFGDSHYLTFLYGEINNPRDFADDRQPYGPDGIFGGTTVKTYLAWQITPWLSLKGTIAYTGILNSKIRREARELGDSYWFCGEEGASYPRDLLWGGLSLNMEF